ncbi:hypothetical protein [Actinoallomurus soli]|uniref:hypothetical protein n=1 Tax=Actinoallomurus soli TaxID=2952535 RepID=UPI002092DFD3|nr:hypothetical protein [Actinoallomurus soli]MCO5974773.1 hypothetical protein [Actinoallomurus soli]
MIAAVLLIALAFLGGPDLLTAGHAQAPAAAATSAAGQDDLAGEESADPASVTAHVALGRRRMPGLPPDQDTRQAAPTAGMAAGPAAGSAVATSDRGLAWHPLERTPASLQVFRC